MKPYLYQSPTAQIGMTCTYSKKAFSLMLKEAGISITVEQMAILNLLVIEDNLSMRDLAEKTFTDNSAITRIIDNLQKYGMVKRKSEVKDRRLKLIGITSKGKDEVRKANQIGKKYVKAATNGISKKELDNMVLTLKKIRINITQVNGKLDGTL